MEDSTKYLEETFFPNESKNITLKFIYLCRNSENHIRSKHPSSVVVNSMKQVTVQEILISLQQNMVIYKAEEAQKHSIGRVIHFDANMFSLEMFQSNNKGKWKSISELVSLSRKCIVYGPIKLNKRGTIKKFLLNNHVD